MNKQRSNVPAKLADNVQDWAQYNADSPLIWHSIHQWPAPKRLLTLNQTPAVEQVLKLIQQGIAIVWDGDFHQGRQLLQALKRRISIDEALPEDTAMPAGFHQLRMRKSQQARQLGQILVRIEPDWHLQQRRAPEIRAACLAAWPALAQQTAPGTLTLDLQDQLPTPLLMPMTQLQGILSAYQWQCNGVPIEALGELIYPQYGVFAPTRQEYLQLINQATLPDHHTRAIDLGTGTGVIAALLLRRGFAHVQAIDLHPAALSCAQHNLNQLGLSDQVTVQTGDLLQTATPADLIVCNPPWLPGTVRNPLDAAIYDPDSRMLRGFLMQVRQHLNPGGQAWLILSDLAELLGLRSRKQLLAWIAEAGLTVTVRHDTRPSHNKATRQNDPLAPWRKQEVTSLWQLSSVETPAPQMHPSQ